MSETQQKRTPDYNVDKNAINYFDNNTLLSVYEKILNSRYFEEGMIKAFDEGRIVKPIFLSMGQESVAAALSELVNEYYIFVQHRVHDLYLSLGASPEGLRDELMDLPTGFNGGRAGSNVIGYMKDGIRMVWHQGLIGDQVPQAVGCALASGEKTLCILGDGSAEEDYVLEALGFAATAKVPVLFICMDNDLSILTKIEVRRSWDIVDVAKSFGVEAYDMSDCPWSVLKRVKSWESAGPLLLNIRVCRERWHAGTGIDGPREWEREKIVRNQLIEKGLTDKVCNTEKKARSRMEELWKK